MTGVLYPEMRDEIRYAAAALCDEKFQNSVWIEANVPRDDFAYSFEMACHTILDDTDFIHDPESLVGIIVDSDRELRALSVLAIKLGDLVERAGPRASFADVVQNGEWSGVLHAAEQVSHIMGRPAKFP